MNWNRDDDDGKGADFRIAGLPDEGEFGIGVELRVDPIGQLRTADAGSLAPLERDVVIGMSCTSYQTKHICLPEFVLSKGTRTVDITPCCEKGGTAGSDDQQPECECSSPDLPEWDRDNDPCQAPGVEFLRLTKGVASQWDISAFSYDPIGQLRRITTEDIDYEFELPVGARCLGQGYQLTIEKFCVPLVLSACAPFYTYFGPCCP